MKRRVTVTLGDEAVEVLRMLPSGQRSGWVDWAVREMADRVRRHVVGEESMPIEENELSRVLELEMWRGRG